MTDFEKGIFNACAVVFSRTPIYTCFYHFGQSMYRKIQSEGLQQFYNNPENRNLKLQTHMQLSLAFLPPDDVANVFDLLVDEIEEELLPIADYFEEYYVRVRPDRERRKAVLPRYPISLWNQYDATLSSAQKTNNCSEGWHNRFHLLSGKNHPDLYSLLRSFQTEQADVETMCRELGMGRKVAAGMKKKWMENQNRIRRIVEDYETFKPDAVLQYLENLAHTINL